MVVVREQLLRTLRDVEYDHRFFWFLKWTVFKNSIPLKPWPEMTYPHKRIIVDLLVNSCGLRSVEVIREVFMNMNRTDLVEMQESSSGSKGTMKSQKYTV